MKGILWWLQLTALRDSRPGRHEGQPGRARWHSWLEETAERPRWQEFKRHRKERPAQREVRIDEHSEAFSWELITTATEGLPGARREPPQSTKPSRGDTPFRNLSFLICKLRSSAESCIGPENSPLWIFFFFKKKKIPESHPHYAWDAVMGISTIKSTLTTTTTLPRPRHTNVNWNSSLGYLEASFQV